ncbi:methyltransferase small domain-containing protein [Hirsutella rhossiliensis]|uniref:Methyltransferase small domain-containing protein n=1 Tax=Hirsutella rhossiliensis TaxID=111463 RepID=A0A9P8SGE4_9HYPO|nr:methyltransferase small domain-containing protein [Hirsutella rhossiliensis]KAH0961696.1 methyltransferase small domain-containing protein [Hirsutella rhossiliensis]
MASPRNEWEKRISELIVESKKHETAYLERIGSFAVYIHPTVYSPKYFPETLWYGESLPSIVQGKSFLEVGVGSGLVSLHLAASGSTVVGVDINPYAVETTRMNFKANSQAGSFFVSDIFGNVSGTFDFIFWNHPWQIDASIPQELKSEKTFDEDYRLLKRFIAQAKNYLTEDGSILLGTSSYADLEAMVAIYAANGYAHEIVRQGQRSIGKGVIEEYYIVQVRQC